MSVLRLYPKHERDFDNNGLGVLIDVIDDEVYAVLNGQFELSFKYPINGSHYADLAKGLIVTADSSPVSGPQPFEIYRVRKLSKGLVEVFCRHVAYKARKITVAPFSAASVADAMVGLKNHAVNDCPFLFSTDKSTAADFGPSVPTSMWSLMGGTAGSLLDVYGGEWEFDGFDLKLWNRRGADRGVTIRYGKNLTSLEQDENIANTYTGAYPYWTDADGGYVELPEKKLIAEGNWDEELIMPLDCSQAFEEAPTVDQLREYAQNYMENNGIGKPDISWTVEFVQLEQTEEYKGKAVLERVLLGDTVKVYFPLLDVDASARAVAARYQPTLDRYKSITLGKVKANLASTIVQQSQSLKDKPSLSMVQRITMTLTAAILGARGGAVRLLDTDGDSMPDTLYIADDPDPAKAMKVWRFNYEGWGVSKTGWSGPYIMGATLEDGLLAAFVTAANLVAGTIKSADNGKTFFLDLDNGILRMNATALSIGGVPVDTMISNAIGDQTQQDLFNTLTNNGAVQGIYLKNNKVYINLEYADTGFLAADNIKLRGLFEVKYTLGGEELYSGGYVGYAFGSISGVNTDGIAIMDPNKQCYAIATTEGVRLQAGDFDIHITREGNAAINCKSLKINDQTVSYVDNGNGTATMVIQTASAAAAAAEEAAIETVEE